MTYLFISSVIVNIVLGVMLYRALTAVARRGLTFQTVNGVTHLVGECDKDNSKQPGLYDSHKIGFKSE